MKNRTLILQTRGRKDIGRKIAHGLKIKTGYMYKNKSQLKVTAELYSILRKGPSLCEETPKT